MNMILTFLGIGAALVVCTLIFAGAVCWLTHEEETMRGEDDVSPEYRAAVKEWHWEDDEDD